MLQGERKMANSNVTMGRFQLTGISPAPRGVPQIEVKFDIDVNGIVHVSAKDMATGKEQTITITSSSGLSSEEIERMVHDAEQFAEEDERKLKEIEIRNTADSMVYQADKTLKDFADKIEETDRQQIEQAKTELEEALQGSDTDLIETKTQALTEAIYTVSAKMYEAANPQDGQDVQDDVVDADYNIPEDD